MVAVTIPFPLDRGTSAVPTVPVNHAGLRQVLFTSDFSPAAHAARARGENGLKKETSTDSGTARAMNRITFFIPMYIYPSLFNTISGILKSKKSPRISLRGDRCSIRATRLNGTPGCSGLYLLPPRPCRNSPYRLRLSEHTARTVQSLPRQRYCAIPSHGQ